MNSDLNLNINQDISASRVVKNSDYENDHSSDLSFDGKKYISSSRAARISGYANDYVGQLCRNGKLECRMVGRSWYVSLDSIISHKSLNIGNSRAKSKKVIQDSFISEVTKQEIPSVVTFEQVFPDSDLIETKNNIEVVDVGEELNYELNNIDSAHEIHIPLNVIKNIPENIYKQDLITKVNNVKSNSSNLKSPYIGVGISKTKLARVFVAFIFIITTFAFGQSLSKNTQAIYKNFSNSTDQIFLAVVNNGGLLFASVAQGSHSIFDNLAINFYKNVNSAMFEAQAQILALLGRESEDEPVNTSPHIAQAPQNSSDGQGMVVFPVDEKTNQDAVIAKIKDSFSDEVQVVPKQDGVSGVITPVFRRAANDNYLYVLVPIKN